MNEVYICNGMKDFEAQLEKSRGSGECQRKAKVKKLRIKKKE